MKASIFLLPLGCMLLAGCVNTYGLNEEQVNQAYDKYADWFVIKSNDTCAETTGKVISRSLFDLMSIGIFEKGVAENKTNACRMLYIDNFVGKTKHDVILAFGAPDRSFDDGNGGEVITYEKYELYGNSGDLHSRLKKTTFFIDKKSIVYGKKLSVE